MNLLFPEVPLTLSVSCMMAEVPAAFLPIPISLGLLTMLIAGLSITNAIPVFVAALTGFLVVKGFGLVRPAQPDEEEGKPADEHD